MYLGLSPVLYRAGTYNGLLRGFTRDLAFPGLNLALFPHTIPAPAAPVSSSTPPRSSSPTPGFRSSKSDSPHSKKSGNDSTQSFSLYGKTAPETSGSKPAAADRNPYQHRITGQRHLQFNRKQCRQQHHHRCNRTACQQTDGNRKKISLTDSFDGILPPLFHGW